MARAVSALRLRVQARPSRLVQALASVAPSAANPLIARNTERDSGATKQICATKKT